MESYNDRLDRCLLCPSPTICRLWIACSPPWVVRRLQGRHSSVTTSPLRCRTGLSRGAQGLGKTATMVPSRWYFARGHRLDTLADWWGLQRHCGGTGDQGLFAPQSTCPGSSWRQGVSPAVHLHGPAPSATPHHHPHSAELAHTRRTQCNRGCGNVQCWAVCSIAGRRAATTPYVQRADRGLGRWPRGQVKREEVPDAAGITPSGVSKGGGRQGCRREVSAQGGDEHLSGPSEPGNSSTLCSLHKTRQNLFVKASVTRLQTAEPCDHTDNSIPDHTANNDNGANCRMH